MNPIDKDRSRNLTRLFTGKVINKVIVTNGSIEIQLMDGSVIFANEKGRDNNGISISHSAIKR